MKINKSLKKILKIGTVSFFVVVSLIAIIGYTFSSSRYSSGDIRMKKVVKSPQYIDGKFLNINPSPEMSFFKMAQVMWEFLTVKNERKPKLEIPSKKIDFAKITNDGENELKITWVGHSSQIINIDGKIILTDPVYENKTVFMGPSRYNGEVPLNIKDIPETDLVLITHNHYDHLNEATIKKIYPKVKKFLVPLLVGAELEKMGVPREKITELDWWEEIHPFDNFLITLTPAQHFSGRSI